MTSKGYQFQANIYVPFGIGGEQLMNEAFPNGCTTGLTASEYDGR